MRIVLFDIDGTLLVSGGAGARALDRAFEELHHIPGAFGGIRPDGMTDDDIVQEMGRRSLGRSLAAREVEAMRARYAFYMKDEIPRSEKFRVMPGVDRLLPVLAARKGLILGLATGNYEPTGKMKLARGGLDGHFRFGGWGTDSSDRLALTRIGIERGRALADTPVPDHHVFLVGDTVHDIRCGKEAPARVVAVATGSTPAETLRAKDPDFLLPDLTAPERFLEIVLS